MKKSLEDKIKPKSTSESASSLASSSTDSVNKVGCGNFTTRPLKFGKVSIKDYSLGYEIHGQERGYPVIRVMGVMGFMNSMGGWDRVMDRFINRENDEFDYQFLVFDNRGIGESTQGSFSRMTTASLAKDALAVLNHIGWTGERSVHLMGISMGGMIALELALLATSRFKSLTLLVTGARWRAPPQNRFVGLSVIRPTRGTIDDRIKNLMSIIYSDDAFLDSECNQTRYPNFKTNREQIHANLKKRMESVKKPSLSTFLGQLCAIWTHYVPKEKLVELGQQITDMLSVGAAADKIVDPELSREIANESGCKLLMYQEKGHVITTEAENDLLPEMKKLWHQAEKRYL